LKTINEGGAKMTTNESKWISRVCLHADDMSAENSVHLDYPLKTYEIASIQFEKP
jgi:hypothetical protein